MCIKVCAHSHKCIYQNGDERHVKVLFDRSYEQALLISSVMINQPEFKDALVNFYQLVFQRSLNMSAPISVEIHLKDQVHYYFFW